MYHWLPEAFDESVCDIEARYSVFKRDYLDDPPTVFFPKRLIVNTTITEDGREEAFHHLTTTGKAGARQHDPHRCSRITWGRPVIQNRRDQHIKRWRIKQNGENRLKIAFHDFSFLIVLAEENRRVRLVTAFYPHRQHSRDKIRKEWEREAQV